ncbi:monovalent cation/H(+) antiporter subunit G [Ruficoccus amylovorans]|uniref:Monovalent cation/H(+) antiporter subunit G n=1 Tax=Ruficoccus amylovorans TaxID=1804625 RepID=A0A842HFG7_9BACT|nr:monovalent cation/H(+) antiporter subunit G [Ruficoccus amylovorans]MBC2595263.1 monovalent cation/H(+) antiporter subunit G [Ruficoccus amylovorans]
MITVIASFCLLVGGFFSLVAALGLYRFPDFYSRIHAATKASTFGLGFSALAVALALGTFSAWLKMLAAVLFIFVTLPIAAHLLSRSVLTREKPRDGLDEG